MTKAECAEARVCTLSGAFTVTSDGHTIVGVMTLADGSCVNVYVKPREMEGSVGMPSVQRTVTGRVFPDSKPDAFTEIRIKGRRVGYGQCSDFFVFED